MTWEVVPCQRRSEELEVVVLMEALVAHQHQLKVVDQSLLLVGEEYSCREQVSIDRPAIPSV